MNYTEVYYLRIALDESVALQSHYAVLLNIMDGGKRLTFTSGDDWINRLKEIGRIGSTNHDRSN